MKYASRNCSCFPNGFGYRSFSYRQECDVKLFSYRLQRYVVILKYKTFHKNILTFQNKQDDYNGMYSQPDKDEAAGTVLKASRMR